MSEVRTLMKPAVDIVTQVVDRAGEADLDSPTPCTDFTLRELVSHVTGTTTGMARIGRGEALDPDNPWGSDAERADWAAQLRENLEAIGAGWSRSEAWTGSVTTGGTEMPAAVLGDMAFVEVLLHGWDLARATGQSMSVPGPMAAELHRAVSETAELGRSMGAYADEVSVPDDADDFARALAAAGRDPGWTAPAP